MIRLLMRGVAEKLHSHRHIKHFKSDLHHYIESLFDDSHTGPLWCDSLEVQIRGINYVNATYIYHRTSEMPFFRPREKMVQPRCPDGIDFVDGSVVCSVTRPKCAPSVPSPRLRSENPDPDIWYRTYRTEASLGPH
jgi:hypothetical protein